MLAVNTTVDRERDSRDVRRVVGEQPGDRGRDLVGSAEAAERDVAAHLLVELGRTLLERHGHAGAGDRTRAHRVHPHAVGAEIEWRPTRAKLSTPPFDALYAHMPGSPNIPETEAVTTIAPPRRTQRGDRRADPEDHTAEVHREHAIELLDRLRLDRSTRADACVQRDSVQGDRSASTAVSTIAAFPVSVVTSATHATIRSPSGSTVVDPSQPVSVAIHGDDRPAVAVQAPRGRTDRCRKPHR